MTSGQDHVGAGVRAALEVHLARRAGGVPTVTTLVGRRGDLLLFGRTLGLADAVCSEPTLTAISGAWVTSILRRQPATVWLANCLARSTAIDAAQLATELERRTPAELELFFEHALGDRGASHVEVARTLLQWPTAGRFTTTPGAREAAAGLQFITALHALAGPSLPPLLFVAEANVRGHLLIGAASLITDLVQAVPSATVALAVEPSQFAALVRDAPDRVRSLLAAGMIPVSSGEEPASPVTCAAQPSPEGFVSPSDPLGDARSAAEAFLFARLEALPQTAGRFELNGLIEVRAHDGARQSVEVDLLARTLRLAVEIDGFHHFREPDSYRRDRRKDLLLQRAGFTVVRVLADDVVTRLEEILDTVLGVVRERTQEVPEDGRA